MEKKKISTVFPLAFLAIIVIFDFTLFEVSAQTPKGVMKGAWHFNISADWLDPSITSPQIQNLFPLYVYHDSRNFSLIGFLLENLDTIHCFNNILSFILQT